MIDITAARPSNPPYSNLEELQCDRGKPLMLANGIQEEMFLQGAALHSAPGKPLLALAASWRQTTFSPS